MESKKLYLYIGKNGYWVDTEEREFMGMDEEVLAKEEATITDLEDCLLVYKYKPFENVILQVQEGNYTFNIEKKQYIKI